MAGDVRDTLLLPFESDAVSPSEPGERWAFINAAPLPPNSVFRLKGLSAEQPMRRPYLDLSNAGYSVTPRLDPGIFDGALVLCGRSRRGNEISVARAKAFTRAYGNVVVAGDKNAGIQPLRKWVAGRIEISGNLSKHHAQVFWFQNDGADWDIPAETVLADGFETPVDGFSAGKIDTGSQLLAETIENELPDRITGHVADFGAGWGFLSAKLLELVPGISQIDLYEAHYGSLTAAQKNIADNRAKFHWVDITREAPRGPFDWIIMNPPFHQGRAAQASLGTAFVDAAARALPAGGKLLMVANAHLPYEQPLRAAFRSVEVLEQSNGFKVLLARS